MMTSPDQIDLRGEVCPHTFVRVRLWLEQAPLQAELVAHVDYEPGTRQIPRALALLGQRHLATQTVVDGWTLHIKKVVLDPTEQLA
jgi:tRNA 2-thiouridine synthesizing protein A